MENAVVLFLSGVEVHNNFLADVMLLFLIKSAKSWFLDSFYQQSFLFTNLWSCHLFERYKYSIVKNENRYTRCRTCIRLNYVM